MKIDDVNQDDVLQAWIALRWSCDTRMGNSQSMVMMGFCKIGQTWRTQERSPLWLIRGSRNLNGGDQ
jgi:hypothetical protein